MRIESHTIVVKICQGGKIKCPICEEKFVWSYKLTATLNSEGNIESIPAIINASPDNITYVVVGDDCIKFHIPCRKCFSLIETSTTNMINKNNYLMYSNSQ